MWASGSDRGEPVAYIDGVPIYADGSRGRPGEGLTTHNSQWDESDAAQRVDRAASAAGWSTTQADNAAAMRSGEPGSPNFDSLVQYDDSSRQRARGSLKFIVPIMVIVGFVMSGIIGTAAELIDDAKGTFREINKGIEGTNEDTPEATATLPPVQERGSFTWYVVAVTGSSAIVREGGPGGRAQLLKFYPDDPGAIQAMRAQVEGFALVRWERRGPQLFVASAAPSSASRAGGTPPS